MEYGRAQLIGPTDNNFHIVRFSRLTKPQLNAPFGAEIIEPWPIHASGRAEGKA